MLIKPFAIYPQYPRETHAKPFVSWETFERRFGPIPRENGNYLWQLRELDTNNEENHWWTVYQSENHILLTPEVCLCDVTYGYLKSWVQWGGRPCFHPYYLYKLSPASAAAEIPPCHFVRAPWDAVRTADARH